MEKAITLTSTGTVSDRVGCVKAIRIMSGVSLKEAVDVINGPGPHRVSILPTVSDVHLNTYKNLLRQNGIQVSDSVSDIIWDLRKLANKCLDIGEDNLANEILQLVLAEKLKRQTE